MQRLSFLAGVFALMNLVGCVAPHITAPAGYVPLRHPGAYDFRAVSAHGNVVALRTRPNEDKAADLEFWADALEYQKVDLDGMKLVEREPLKSDNGRDGMLFHFELGEGQGRVAYLVGLYVTPERIYIVEAGGPAERVAADIEKIKKSMRSLR